MATAEERGLTKLTANLYEPMYLDFDHRLSKLLIRRDAFLDLMIWQEIPYLRDDMAGKKLSKAANQYIARSLKTIGNADRPPLRQVSIAVKQETAAALRDIVDEHNLVRDAFLNRLILLLRASEKLLDFLFLPKDSSWNKHDVDHSPTSPIAALEHLMRDPFLHLREYSLREHGQGLYTLPLPHGLIGMSCYLEDDCVPGTKAHEESQTFDFESAFIPENKETK